MATRQISSARSRRISDTDKAAALIRARARVEGPQVLLEPLAQIDRWKRAPSSCKSSPSKKRLDASATLLTAPRRIWSQSGRAIR